MPIAVTRPVPPSIVHCELTHLERVPIDVERAREQHHRYERALELLGCTIVRAPAEPEMPDSVFVEDTAVILDELAIVTRPGAESRRGEVESIRPILRRYRDVYEISAPGTLDGGDVLVLGETIYVGVGDRTNPAGAAQLAERVGSFGYRLVSVDLGEALHLKTAVTAVSDVLLVANPEWVDVSIFDGYQVIAVDPEEPFAANVLRVGDRVIVADAFPRTAARLEAAGVPLTRVDASELAKAEAGLTCCSLIFS